MIETSSTYSRQLTHPLNRQFVIAHLLPDLLVDSGFPVNACSIRRSSMRCKHRFKNRSPMLAGRLSAPVPLLGSHRLSSYPNPEGVLRPLPKIPSPAMQQ